MSREIRVGILLTISLMWGYPARSQEIRIRVLNAHNGKPISNECVSVSLGPWHGADLIAPTNREGAVALHLVGNEVTTGLGRDFLTPPIARQMVT